MDDKNSNFFFEQLMHNLLLGKTLPKYVYEAYMEMAKKAYEQGNIEAAKFLIIHYSNTKNEDYDYNFAKTILLNVYDKDKTNFYFSNLIGLFYLDGIGVNKDADKAIDYLLENENDNMNIESDLYLAKIYLDGSNGYKNEDRAFRYITKAVDKLMDQLFKMNLDTFSRNVNQDEEEFLIEKMRNENLTKFKNIYKEAKSLESTNKEKSFIKYNELDNINLASRFLVLSKVYYEGNVIEKNIDKALEYFDKYYECFLDTKEIENYKIDFPIFKAFNKFNELDDKLEIFDENYPIHKKSMVDRYIRKLKEASDYGIESAMVKYGECYMNLFQDFPVDFKKAYQIFSEVQYKLKFSKANIYLFYMNLYGLGTKKDTEEALKIATTVQSESNIGNFLKSLYYFEKRNYKTFVSYIPDFYKTCCELDLVEVKEFLQNEKLDDLNRKRLAKERLYNLKKNTFEPLEALTCLEKKKYKQAYDKLESASFADYNQAYLMLAYFYYKGIYVKKSLPKFKKYVNEFIKSMLGFTKEELLKDGYLEN